jgi:hypothetical protein
VAKTKEAPFPGAFIETILYNTELHGKRKRFFHPGG